jgi:KEOPS complex subunit Cgi121
MLLPQEFHDIRAARCTIYDRDSFLRDLQTVAKLYETHVICFNADMIAGRKHAQAAVAHAVRAYQEGTNISNSLEMEALLYAAGSRQCSIAGPFGIHKGENRVYLCCFPMREGILAELESLFQFVQESWDTIDQEKKGLLLETYGISPEEIAAAGGDVRILDLVLERVALLRVIR